MKPFHHHKPLLQLETYPEGAELLRRTRMEDNKKTYIVVIVRQVLYAGMFLISKAAFDRGMNNLVFVFYRQAAATLVLLPFAFVYERKTAPSMSFATFCKHFLLSFFGITLSFDIYGMALIYTTATLAAASTSFIPVITFFFAVVFRMEGLKVKTRGGIAKVVGMVLCTGGTIVFALYKGPHFSIGKHSIISSHASPHDHPSSSKTWILGCSLMLLSNVLWGLYIVLQGKAMKTYPSKLMFTTLQCLFSAIQSFVIAIIFVRDPKEWKLGWNLTLLTVVYSGVVVSGLTYYLQVWIIEKKGPVFLAMWTPVLLLITLFSSAVFLGEIVTLGSLLGGLLLVGGLYSVLWGKSKDPNLDMKSNMESSELEEEGVTVSNDAPKPVASV